MIREFDLPGSIVMPRKLAAATALPPFSLDLYTDSTEAAQLLGIDRRSLSALAKSGRVKAMKVGRDWWVLRTSLQEYLETKAPTGKKPGRKPRLKREGKSG